MKITHFRLPGLRTNQKIAALQMRWADDRDYIRGGQGECAVPSPKPTISSQAGSERVERPEY
jgi:hypothetical protein